MTIAYQDDMSWTLELIALSEGLRTSYEGLSEVKTASRSKQQSAARRKRRRGDNDDDDAEGPPDSKKAFVRGKFANIICNDIDLPKLR